MLLGKSRVSRSSSKSSWVTSRASRSTVSASGEYARALTFRMTRSRLVHAGTRCETQGMVLGEHIARRGFLANAFRGQGFFTTTGDPGRPVLLRCRCENDTLCPRRMGRLAERRVGGYYWNGADGRVWLVPGFAAFAHRSFAQSIKWTGSTRRGGANAEAQQVRLRAGRDAPGSPRGCRVRAAQ